MFDGELQRHIEVEWITDVEPVYMGPPQPAQVIVNSSIPEVWMGEQGLGTPGSIKVVFGPGAV